MQALVACKGIVVLQTKTGDLQASEWWWCKQTQRAVVQTDTESGAVSDELGKH